MLAVALEDWNVEEQEAPRPRVRLQVCGESILELTDRDFDTLMNVLTRFREMRETRNMKQRTE